MTIYRCFYTVKEHTFDSLEDIADELTQLDPEFFWCGRESIVKGWYYLVRTGSGPRSEARNE